MDPKYVVLTEDNQYGSLYHMALYMVKRLTDKGFEAVLSTRINEQVTGARLVNLLPDKILALQKQKRFLNYKDLVNIFTPNPEEFHPTELLGILGSVHQNPLICHSPQLHDQLLRKLRTTFSPALSRQWAPDLPFIPWGVGGEFQYVPADQKDPLHWLVPYNRLNEGQKNFRLHATISQKATQLLGPTFRQDVILMQHARSNADRYQDELKQYRVVPQVESRDDLPQTLAPYGGFLCTSKYESFGIYYLELLATGAVGVFLDRPWVRKLLPGYPFIVAKDELAPAMRMVATRYPEVQAKVIQYLDTVVFPQYSIARFGDELVSLFDRRAH